MALTFPSSPTNGQVYTDTTTGNRYIYDSSKGLWKYSSNNVGLTVSTTPPSNVAAGAMWFNSSIGRTFVYYNDGDSTQWVETVPAGTVDTNTIAGYVNPVFASMNAAYATTNSAYNLANTHLANTSATFNGNLTLVGNTLPSVDNNYNLGSSSQRWANIYTGDAHFSNEGSEGNVVDGTTGNWTLQEGENNIYMINNKTKKTYKIMLEEV